MRALYFEEHGGLDVLRVGERPAPALAPGQVRIAIRAAALNHLDLFVLEGMPAVPTPLPHTPGSDGAGVVEALGEGVRGWNVGDTVAVNAGLWCGGCEYCLAGEHSLCASYRLIGEHVDGTMAEFICVPQTSCVRVPAHLSIEEAAAFPLTFLTAWRMLTTRALLAPGETVLVHGIGGGVSTAVLILGCALGARVAVTSSSAAKLAAAREMGAELAIDHTSEDVGRAVREWTAKRGADVVVDSVGAATWATSLKCAARGGRIVTCGATSGPNPAEEIRLIFWKQLSILGSTMGSAGEMDAVAGFMAEKGLRPRLDTVLPLERAPEAFARLAAGTQLGKIVLAL